MANTRTTRREEEETPNDSLDAQVQKLRSTVRRQNEIIQTLQATLDANTAGSSAQPNEPTHRIKSPPVSCYSGKPSERTSEKVKSFFYSIHKFGILNKYNDEQLVAFAECYLQDRAASWIMRLETNGTKPTTLEDLKKAMIKEFVPANEKAKARVRLMDIKSHQSSDLEEHIAKFEDLVSLCDTPVNEAYIYFLNSLPQVYKAKFTEKFPTSQPVDVTGQPSILTAYECARTLDLSYKMSGKHKEEGLPKQEYSQKGKRDHRSRDKGQQRLPNRQNNRRKREWKDEDAVCWGPAQSGEGGIYRKFDRCCVCGLKGWSNPSHPCRKDNRESKEKKGSDSKNE